MAGRASNRRFRLACLALGLVYGTGYLVMLGPEADHFAELRPRVGETTAAIVSRLGEPDHADGDRQCWVFRTGGCVFVCEATVANGALTSVAVSAR